MRSFLKSQSIDCIAWTSISRLMHNYRDKHNNYRTISLNGLNSTRENYQRNLVYHLKNKSVNCELSKNVKTQNLSNTCLYCIQVNRLHIQNAWLVSFVFIFHYYLQSMTFVIFKSCNTHSLDVQ